MCSGYGGSRRSGLKFEERLSFRGEEKLVVKRFQKVGDMDRANCGRETTGLL